MRLLQDWLVTIFNLVALTIIALAVWIVFAHSAPGFQTNSFVRLIERHIGAEYNIQVYPGVTKTLPECNCTMRYVGTRVNGRFYDVRIEKLD